MPQAAKLIERDSPREQVLALIEAAQMAADWMCEAVEGSDQWERGNDLREAADAAWRAIAKQEA